MSFRTGSGVSRNNRQADDMSSGSAQCRVYSEFDETLVTAWNGLYGKGANYNLSYEWCSIWFKHFGKSRKLYIITVWDNNSELQLLAPFYLIRNRLALIGTKPDLYDEFNVLYSDEKYLDSLFDHIEGSKLELLLKHVNSESEFAKYFITRIHKQGTKTISSVTETKPSILPPFGLKGKVHSDVKRRKNNAVKQFGDELLFTYCVERKPQYIDEFIALHKKRWDGGLFVKKANVDKFMKDIFLHSEATVLSRLSFHRRGKAVAFHFGYLDSNKVLWSSLPSYDTDYHDISPGKVLLYDLIFYSFGKGIAKFDFGRGSEPYKSTFANNHVILFNMKTYNKGTIIKIRQLIDKILKLIFG